MWSPVKCIFSPVVLGGILGVALGACANLTARPRVSHHIVGESAPFFKNIAEAQLQLKRGDFFVVVSKKDKKLWLQSLKDPATTLLEFPIVSGLNHGDKQIQGDQKTPEGIYFVTHQLPQERLRKVHGAYAFNLDYPNLLDLREKKTGGGIWIHGVEYEDRVKLGFDTRGCVAVGNPHVGWLNERADMRGAAVLIFDRIPALGEVGLEKADGEYRKQLDHWLKVRATGNFESFSSFYDPRFVHAIENREGFLKKNRWRLRTRLYKEAVQKNKRAFVHPKYAVTEFVDQRPGKKARWVRHYWSRDLGRPMIIAEVTQLL